MRSIEFGFLRLDVDFDVFFETVRSQGKETIYKCRPLYHKRPDEKVIANTAETVPFQKRHEKTESDEHHDVDVLKIRIMELDVIGCLWLRLTSEREGRIVTVRPRLLRFVRRLDGSATVLREDGEECDENRLEEDEQDGELSLGKVRCHDDVDDRREDKAFSTARRAHVKTRGCTKGGEHFASTLYSKRFVRANDQYNSSRNQSGVERTQRIQIHLSIGHAVYYTELWAEFT